MNRPADTIDYRSLWLPDPCDNCVEREADGADRLCGYCRRHYGEILRCTSN